MQENLGAVHDVACPLAHQHVIAADIRLTFGAIQDEAFQIGGNCLNELLRGRVDRAAETDDAALQYLVKQLISRQFGIGNPSLAGIHGAILAVAFDDDAGCRVAAPAGDGPGLDGGNSSR